MPKRAHHTRCGPLNVLPQEAPRILKETQEALNVLPQNKHAEAPRILEVHKAGEGVWQQLNQQEQKQTCGSSKKLKPQKNIEDYIPS